MKRQSGITMVALIITIVMMLILVGVTINVSIDGKLFGTTKKVVSDAQKQEEMEVLKTAVYMCLNDETEIDDMDLLKSKLPNEWNTEEIAMGEIKVVSPSGNEFIVDNEGEIFNVLKNDYGFFYRLGYVCRDFYGTTYSNKTTITFLEDGNVKYKAYQDRNLTEGITMNLTNLTNQNVVFVSSLKYNEKYYYTGPDGEYVYYVDSSGTMHIEVLINKDILVYSYNNINVGGAMSCIFSEDGKSFDLNGKTFTIEN